MVAHFPKAPASLSLKRESGPRFKNANELRDVRRWTGALDEDMQMIRHQTVSVENERAAPGTIEEAFEHEFSGRGVDEIRLAEVATDGEEVGFGADVVLGGKTSLFPVPWHGY